MFNLSKFFFFGVTVFVRSLVLSVSTCNDDVITLTATHQTSALFSPNYPDQYPSNLTMCWRISADYERDRIYLYFVSVDVENKNNNTCGDSLVVYDGYNESATVLRRWCSQEMYDVTIKSRGDTVYVAFVTDDADGGRGFAIDYKSDKDKVCYSHVHDLADATRETTTTTLDISYLADQPRTGVCLFRIKAANPDYKIKIKISGNNFDSNSEDGCNETVLMLYDDFTKVENTLGSFCGDVVHDEATFTTSGRFLYMEVITGPGVGVVNMKLQYIQYNDGLTCPPMTTFMSTYDNQTFTSPNYPNDYGPGLNCSYLITTNEDEQIFLDLYTNLPSDCSDRVVLVYGNSTDDVVEVCGERNVSVNSTSHQLLLQFITDIQTNKGGFRAVYRNTGSPPLVFVIREKIWPVALTIVGTVNLVSLVLFAGFCVYLHVRAKLRTRRSKDVVASKTKDDVENEEDVFDAEQCLAEITHSFDEINEKF